MAPRGFEGVPPAAGIRNGLSPGRDLVGDVTLLRIGPDPRVTLETWRDRRVSGD